MRDGAAVMKIKPHHFFDIIKLHGAGYHEFRPDKVYNHDFYRVGNEILKNKSTLVTPVVEWDAICGPCVYLSGEKTCRDRITHIDGIDLKEQWNQTLDARIFEYGALIMGKSYTAEEFCERLYSIKEDIFRIWREDDLQATQKRYELFCRGAGSYLKKSF